MTDYTRRLSQGAFKKKKIFFFSFLFFSFLYDRKRTGVQLDGSLFSPFAFCLCSRLIAVEMMSIYRVICGYCLSITKSSRHIYIEGTLKGK